MVFVQTPKTLSIKNQDIRSNGPATSVSINPARIFDQKTYMWIRSTDRDEDVAKSLVSLIPQTCWAAI